MPERHCLLQICIFQLLKQASREAFIFIAAVTLQEGKAIAANDEPILLEGEEVIESVQRADSPGQMWTAIGQDSYSVVPIQSTLHSETQLEGTRLTVVQLFLLTLNLLLYGITVKSKEHLCPVFS